MNRRELEQAIRDEVAEWPGVTVEFAEGGSHPKAKLTFTPAEGDPLMLSRAFGGNQAHVAFPHKMIADMRKAMAQLGATRNAPEPTNEETEKRYHKPNPGADLRPDPVKGEPAAVKVGLGEKLVAAGVNAAEKVGEAAERVFAVGADVLDKAEATRGRVEAAKGGRYAAFETASAPTVEEEDTPEGAARLHALLTACGLEFSVAPDASVSDVVVAALALIEDGVYFGLPDVVYHAVSRLSSSGLQRLCVSPATFWRGSWLDPDRPELDEDETKAQQLGKAYHVARLEPDRFHATYVRQIDKSDFPAKGFLSSDEKVKAELKARSLQQTVSGESAGDRAERLLDAGYEGVCFTLEKEKWEATVAGRIPLPAKYFDQIVTDMERIRSNDDIAELLTGGEAEVSVFWTDRYGLKMKCRFDYLTPGWWDDFKTFDNSRGKELEQALADAVRYNRYHVQGVTYRDAAEAIRMGGLQIKSAANDAQRALVAAIQIKPDELACFYVFQEKGGIPNLLAMDFPFYTVPISVRIQSQMMLNAELTDQDGVDRVAAATRVKSGLHIRAIQDIDKAKRDFMLYSEVYEPGQPWSPIEPVRRFSDNHFNRYWLEGTA